MNIKKILVLLLFVIAIIGIIAPANAIYISPLEPKIVDLFNDKYKLKLTISPNLDPTTKESKKAKELNKINKVVVKIDGKTVKTIKKIKGGIDTMITLIG